MLLRYFYNGAQYAIEYDAQHIIFTNCDSGKKTAVKVLDSADFTWKLNKKSIAAAGGARGLFCFFDDAIKADFMTAYINRTIAFYGA